MLEIKLVFSFLVQFLVDNHVPWDIASGQINAAAMSISMVVLFADCMIRLVKYGHYYVVERKGP